MPNQKFDFPNDKGEKLSGRLELPVGKPIAYAVFAHCFTCSKSLLAATRIPRRLTEKGIAVLRFDFTGLGNSEGDFANTNFSSNVQDLFSACKALGEQYEAPSILIGHSLGGAAVLKAATQMPDVKAVVTIGAPSNVEHVADNFSDDIQKIEEQGEAEVNLAGRKFKIKKQFLDDLKETSVLDGISKFKKSLLVMHSPIDNTVSIDHASKIFLAAKHPKSFVSLDNADHLVTSSKDAQYAADVIGAWVERFLPERVEAAMPEGVVRVESIDGHKFTQTIMAGEHKVWGDEPKSVGGDNLGMTPYQFLLSALGTCTSMTMQMYARHKNFPLESVQVDLQHNKIHTKDCEDCETEIGKVDEITKHIQISGPLTPEQRQRILEIAEKCPVNKTLKSEIKIRQTGE